MDADGRVKKRWEMGDGRWEMGDGRWEMGDGRWEMGDGRWEMGDGRWLAVFVDDDAEAEDLLEEIGLGVHGESLDGGIGEAGKADAEFAGVAGDFDSGDALGVGALEGIGHSEEGGELGDADAVIGAESGIA
jgi:hypothetical protein